VENFEDEVPTVISRPYGYGSGEPLVEHQEEIERRLELQEATA
jgi:cytochrome c oxidase subunit 1